MRLALLGLALPLFTLPLAAQTFSHVSQSSTTLAASFSRRESDDERTVSTRGSGEDLRTTIRYDMSTVRFSNSDLLEVLVEEGVISEKKGWALLAVWADWDSSGASSHRFFVRKKISGGYDIRRVPDTRLKLELIDPFVAKTVKFEEDELISGSDQFKAYSSVFLGADTRGGEEIPDDDADRSTAATTSYGMTAGSGRYARPATAAATFYLPNAFTFIGYSNASDGDLVSLSLKLGKSSAVASSVYEKDEGEDLFTGTNPSRGVDAVAVPPPIP